MRTRTRATDQGNSQPEANGAATVAESKISFFERLQQLGELDWDKHQIYIYRRWPRISKSDSPHYIETVRHPIDEEWLLEHHGSGRYSLRLNDRKRTLDSHICEVHDLDRPPKVQPAELIDCPENERYRELWPDNPEKAVAVNGKALSTVDNGAATAAVEAMAAITKQALQRPPAEPKAPDGISDATAKVMLEMAAGRDALAAKLATPAPVINPIDSLDAAVNLIKKLAPVPTASPTPSPLQHAKDVLELFTQMREVFGGTTANAPTPDSDNSVATVIIREVGEVLKGPLNILTQVWAAQAMSRPQPVPGYSGMAPSPTAGFPHITPTAAPAPPPNNAPVAQQPQSTAPIPTTEGPPPGRPKRSAQHRSPIQGTS